MASQPTAYLTPEQYLELERKADFKSEYFNGEVFAMSGASANHILIVDNVTHLLLNQLTGRACRPYSSNMRVRVGDSRLYTYPDIAIVCGKPQFSDDHKDTMLNPNVIIEVLSPSTEAYDRGRKSELYRSIDSLSDYILVSQDRPKIECFSRQADGFWKFSETTDLRGTMEVRSIDCTLTLDNVYISVDLST